MIERIQTSLALVKEKKPLVFCLTNYVTTDFIANALLALGASPLMSESIEEIEELVKLCDALYINIGTLNQAFMIRAAFATQIANALDKPIILDPVGAGASKLRSDAALQLLPQAHLIRCNASELLALAGVYQSTRGVEAVHEVQEAMASASTLARDLDKVLIISGQEDFITDGEQSHRLPFGAPLMPLITGMGCTLTAVISAFAALNSNYVQAAVDATAYFGLCGQLAYQQTKVPGSFKQVFINHLYQPDWGYFKEAAQSQQQKLKEQPHVC